MMKAQEFRTNDGLAVVVTDDTNTIVRVWTFKYNQWETFGELSKFINDPLNKVSSASQLDTLFIEATEVRD